MLINQRKQNIKLLKLSISVIIDVISLLFVQRSNKLPIHFTYLSNTLFFHEYKFSLPQSIFLPQLNNSACIVLEYNNNSHNFFILVIFSKDNKTNTRDHTRYKCGDYIKKAIQLNSYKQLIVYFIIKYIFSEAKSFEHCNC